MPSPACPSCGSPHPPEQRYCLACGTLVGERAVDLDQAMGFQREPASAPDPVIVSAATPRSSVSVWRRPSTSILATLALAGGVVGGFLLEPLGSAASRTPVVVADAPVASPTPTPADALTAATPAATVAAQATTTAAPTANGTGAHPTSNTSTPAAVATVAPVTNTTASPSSSDAVSVTATPTATATPTKTPSAKTRQGTTATDSGLPKIEHIWVVGIGTPVTAGDGYLGDTLLTRGTVLSRYAPTATDPLAGAAALIAGGAPSAKAKTIAGQLTTANLAWSAYSADADGCTEADSAIPLLAFASVTSSTGCARHIGDLGSIPIDVKSADTTPAFSYIATDPTLDAAALDTQLQQIVEPIRKSAAYKKAGLIAIVPTSANPIAATGALLLSPFAASATEISTKLGPYALLRTFEDLLSLAHLGHAADADIHALGPAILTPDP